MSFPINPLDNQKTTQNNIIYVYSTATNSWRRDLNNIIDRLTLGGGYASTSTTTGALVVYGGAGITQDLYVGGLIHGTLVGGGASTTTIAVVGGQAGEVLYQSSTSTTAFTNVGTTGSVLVSYGTGQPLFQNHIALSSTATSTTSDTGALTVSGGVGIGGDLHIAGQIYVNGIPISSLPSGAPWQIISTSTYQAVHGDRLMINTTASTVTVVLPLTPMFGDTVEFIDYGLTFGLNTATIARNSELIMGFAEDLILDLPGAANTLVYSGTSQGWKLGAVF